MCRAIRAGGDCSLRCWRGLRGCDNRYLSRLQGLHEHSIHEIATQLTSEVSWPEFWSRTEGSAGGRPSSAHLLDSYFDRMKDSILL